MEQLINISFCVGIIPGVLVVLLAIVAANMRETIDPYIDLPRCNLDLIVCSIGVGLGVTVLCGCWIFFIPVALLAGGAWALGRLLNKLAQTYDVKITRKQGEE